MDSYTIQSGTGQDYSGHAKYGDTSYCFVFDGHGSNDCIDYIRTLDMNQYALTECPPRSIEQAFAGKQFYRSGATFVLARIRQNTLEIFHVGDAKAQVFLNGKLVHETLDHTFQNPIEIARTTARIQPSKAPFPVSDTEVQMIDSSVGYFPNGESFVPSQTLGHNGISGLDPGHYTLTFDIFDHIRVVCGSDGFWDMLPPTIGTAKILCEEGVRRWKQYWTFGNSKTTYSDYDDVSVAILDNAIALPPSVCIPYSLSCFQEKHLRTAFPFHIYKIDEVLIRDHKAFFLHFDTLSTEHREFLQNIYHKSVKLYYNDHWFWHLKLRGHFQLIEQEFIDLEIPLHHYHDFIPTFTFHKIISFLTIMSRSF